MSLYIGLMSGTSMDGIDAAVVDVSKNRLLYGITKKYSKEVQKHLEKLILGYDLSLASISQLNTLIGKEFAATANELLREAKLSPREIQAIGSHGQTVCHNTNCSIPYTMQLGCAHTISSLTGTTVVADFRVRDLVHGGQGAPFAPLYHQELFKDKTEPTAVVNIGGISNVTVLHPNESIKGWDIGPGNCLMDAWIMKHQGKAYDAHGAWAQQGTVIQPLLELLSSDPFISLPAPKSIGKEYFSLSWLERYVTEEYRAVDVQNTLLTLTAKIIADAVLNEKNHINTVYICGGGTHNIALVQKMSQLLPESTVTSIADIGVSPDFVEAMMFAWLAAQTIHQIPVDLSTITGSNCPIILGAIYPLISSPKGCS